MSGDQVLFRSGKVMNGSFYIVSVGATSDDVVQIEAYD
jgi:hypothetical protein